jgi:hypothetical protein
MFKINSTKEQNSTKLKTAKIMAEGFFDVSKRETQSAHNQRNQT